MLLSLTFETKLLFHISRESFVILELTDGMVGEKSRVIPRQMSIGDIRTRYSQSDDERKSQTDGESPNDNQSINRFVTVVSSEGGTNLVMLPENTPGHFNIKEEVEETDNDEAFEEIVAPARSYKTWHDKLGANFSEMHQKLFNSFSTKLKYGSLDDSGAKNASQKSSNKSSNRSGIEGSFSNEGFKNPNAAPPNLHDVINDVMNSDVHVTCWLPAEKEVKPTLLQLASELNAEGTQ